MGKRPVAHLVLWKHALVANVIVATAAAGALLLVRFHGITGQGEGLDRMTLALIWLTIGAAAWGLYRATRLVSRTFLARAPAAAAGRSATIVVWMAALGADALAQSLGSGLPRATLDESLFQAAWLSIAIVAVPTSMAVASYWAVRDPYPAAMRLPRRAAPAPAPMVEPRAQPMAAPAAPVQPAGPAQGIVEIERPSTRFADVVGLSDAKRELKEAMHLMLNPSDGQEYGVTPPRGVLLHGPPGTGKTLFARAAAGEFGTAFMAVSGTEIKSKWFSETGSNIKAVFDQARANYPCILFIDEFDAVAADRSSMQHSWEKESVIALLEQLDGIRGKDRAPLVLAATNHVEALDPAVTRPGRFDRRILVGLPDAEARAQLLRMALDKRAARVDPQLDVASWAQRLRGWSPAKIVRLVEDAAQDAWRRHALIGEQSFATAWGLQA